MSNAVLEREDRMTTLLISMDGQKVELDGISGVIKVDRAPVTHTHGKRGEHEHSLSVRHEPDDHGRMSQEYQWIREQAGDDWVTDLTGSPSVIRRIAQELGLDPS